MSRRRDRSASSSRSRSRDDHRSTIGRSLLTPSTNSSSRPSNHHLIFDKTSTDSPENLVATTSNSPTTDLNCNTLEKSPRSHSQSAYDNERTSPSRSRSRERRSSRRRSSASSDPDAEDPVQTSPRRSSRSSRHRSPEAEGENINEAEEPKLRSKSDRRKSEGTSRSSSSNQNQNRESRSQSRSKHRKDSPTNSNIKPQFEDSEFDLFDTPAALEDSVQSSVEGTPVILSREGSHIRIVDQETGEVFFRKWSKSSRSKNRRKEPIFIPRMSSQHKMELPLQVKMSLEKDALSFSSAILGVGRRHILESPDNYDGPEQTAPNGPPLELEEEEDDVGDIFVFDKPVKRGFNSLTDILDEQNLVNEVSDDFDEKNPRGILKKAKAQKSANDINCTDELNELEGDLDTEMFGGADAEIVVENVEQKLGNYADEDADFDNENEVSAREPSRSRTSSKSKSDIDERSKSRTSKPDRKSTKSRSRSSRSKSQTGLKDSGEKDGTMMLSREIFEHIFRFLGREDLKMCSRVCSRWKKMTDLRLRGPLLFRGQSFYGHFYSKQRCRDFVTKVQELEARYFRPVEIYFSRANNSQIRAIVGELGAEFRSAVRHIESLRLENCSMKWKTLVPLLQSFSNIRILTDINSDYFTQDGTLVCQRFRENLKKEMSRKEFTDFKDQMKSLKRLTIHRKTVSHELVIYLTILTRGTRYLQEFELQIGPWETNSRVDRNHFTKLLNSFIKELRNLLEKNRKYLRKIKFVWLDKNYTGYFVACVDVLASIRLNNLRDLCLEFDGHAMKGKNSGDLREFIQYHFARSLRQFRLSKMHLGEDWKSTAGFLDKLEVTPASSGCFNFKIIVSDSSTSKAHVAAISRISQMRLFRHFTSDVQFNVGNETTKSIAQIFGIDWTKKIRFPKVKSVLITFSPDILPIKSYNGFNTFNIDSIAKCFPNLTQLRISDRLCEHTQIFTRVFGRKKKIGVSKASVENKDLQCIGEFLKRLKVLKLWVNLSSVDDHGVTGIHKDDISILHEDDVNYSWNNFDNEVLPSFSNLKYLEELSLKGLGPFVTDISAKFGFENLSKLKVLELCDYEKRKISVEEKIQRAWKWDCYSDTTVYDIDARLTGRKVIGHTEGHFISLYFLESFEAKLR